MKISVINNDYLRVSSLNIQIMKCKKCGKDVVFPSAAYLNLLTYNVGGSVLSASGCCNKGYVIKMNISYTTTEYLGNMKEDDWGVELRES